MIKNIVKLITAAIITSFVCNSTLISVGAGGTREVNVATVEELHEALTDAKPGDKIIIAPGRTKMIHGKASGQHFSLRQAVRLNSLLPYAVPILLTLLYCAVYHRRTK